MNWFERYGISGTYFTALIVGWLYVFTYTDKSIWNYETMKMIGGIAVFVSLPLGYLISVFSQYLYYKAYLRPLNLIFTQVHKAYSHTVSALRVLGINKGKEDDIEAVLSVRYRLTAIKSCETERHKWLADLMTKRWGVLAINHIFIVATLLAPVFALSLFLLQIKGSIAWSPHGGPFVFMALLSVVIILALCASEKLLSRQLIKIYTELCRYVENRPNNNKS